MVPTTFFTIAAKASFAFLANCLRTFACLFNLFSNTPTSAGRHDTEVVKPFYPKTPLNLIASLKSFSNSGGD